MAKIKTKCPHCKARFTVSHEHKGKEARCSKCKQKFIVSSSMAHRSSPEKPKTKRVDTSKLKEFFSVKELAEMLSVNPMTIYRMVARGQIACHQIGRSKRFRQSDIEKFLSKCVINKEAGARME